MLCEFQSILIALNLAIFKLVLRCDMIYMIFYCIAFFSGGLSNNAYVNFTKSSKIVLGMFNKNNF